MFRLYLPAPQPFGFLRGKRENTLAFGCKRQFDISRNRCSTSYLVFDFFPQLLERFSTRLQETLQEGGLPQ